MLTPLNLKTSLHRRVHLSITSIVAVMLIILFSSRAEADVRIDGGTSFEFHGNMVTIYVDRLVNYSADYTTGTLYLHLVASRSRSLNGYSNRLTEINLASQTPGSGQLMPNYSFENLVVSGQVRWPPRGEYWIHLVVVEYPYTDSIVDSIVYDRTMVF